MEKDDKRLLDSLPLFLHKKDGKQLTEEELKKFIKFMKNLLDNDSKFDRMEPE